MRFSIKRSNYSLISACPGIVDYYQRCSSIDRVAAKKMESPFLQATPGEIPIRHNRKIFHSESNQSVTGLIREVVEFTTLDTFNWTGCLGHHV